MQSLVSKRVHEVIVLDGVGQRIAFEPRENLSNYGLVAITGTVQSANESGFHSLSDPASKSSIGHRTFGEMLGWNGEWVALFSDSGKVNESAFEESYMVASDYFGFGKIHYAFVPSREFPSLRTLIAGPTFRGVARVLDQMGYPSSVAWDVALPHVISHVNLFRTRASRRTFADQIEVLGSDEVLIVSKYGANIVNRPIPNLNEDYESLIEQGIEAAIADAKAASGLGMPMSFSLSGGKDSRALLSMLVAGGMAQDWNIVTKRPGTQAGASTEVFRRDLEYASKIVDKFNLNWHIPRGGYYVQTDFREFLNDYQDFRSNQNFELTPQKHLRREAGESTTMGIGGELLRSYIARGYRDGHPQWWTAAGKTADSAFLDLRSLFSRLAVSWKLPMDLYDQAASSFAHSMMFDLQGTALEHIDKSYGEYRSRAFSSNMESNRHAGSFLTYPLARPEFVAASRLLSPEDRDDGRILFDIIEKSSADLNALPFAAPAWPERFRTRGNEDFWKGASVSRAEVRYQSLLAKAPKIPIIQRNVPPSDFNDSAMSHIGNRFDILRDVGPRNWVDPIISRAARRALMSPGSLYSLLAVVESITDVVKTPPINLTKLSINLVKKISTVHSEHTFSPSGSISENEPLHESKSAVDATETVFVKRLNSIDLSQVSARLIIEPDSSCLTIDILNLPSDCEVAVYILSGGVRIDRTPYRAVSRVNFPDIDPTIVIDRATIFLRWSGEPDALRVFDIGLDH